MMLVFDDHAGQLAIQDRGPSPLCLNSQLPQGRMTVSEVKGLHVGRQCVHVHVYCM